MNGGKEDRDVLDVDIEHAKKIADRISDLMNEEQPNSYVAIKVACSMVAFLIHALPTEEMKGYFVMDLLSAAGGKKIDMGQEEDCDNAENAENAESVH